MRLFLPLGSTFLVLVLYQKEGFPLDVDNLESALKADQAAGLEVLRQLATGSPSPTPTSSATDGLESDTVWRRCERCVESNIADLDKEQPIEHMPCSAKPRSERK